MFVFCNISKFLGLKTLFFNVFRFLRYVFDFWSILGGFVKIMCFLSFSSKSHAETSRISMKKQVWDPKRVKLDQKP